MTERINNKKTPDKRMLGKVIKKEEKEVVVLGRKMIIWIKEFDSGTQRCGAFFADKNRTWLTHQNIKLRKRIQELEKEVKKK